MTPLNALKTGLTKPVTLSGRASRSEFWWFALALVLAGVIAFAIDRLFFTRILMDTVANIQIGTHSTFPALKIWAIASLFLLIPAAVRRLHDTSRRGWWLAILPPAFLLALWSFAAALSGALSSMPRSSLTKFGETLFPFAVALFFATFCFLLTLLARASTPGDNAFGPNPNEVPS